MALHLKKQRVANVSASQKTAMFEFLKQNKQLLSGKFTADFTFKKAQRLWQELTNMLNAIPGAHKNWRQWRKTWQDMRSKCKSKQMLIRAQGGDLTADALTKGDQDIINLINPGDANFEEPELVVPFMDDVEDSKNFEATTPGLFDVLAKQMVKDEVVTDVDVAPVDFDNSNKSEIWRAEKKLSARRSKQAVVPTVKLSDNYNSKLQLQQDYYSKKLALLERQVLAKEKSATALEGIASALVKLSN